MKVNFKIEGLQRLEAAFKELRLDAKERASFSAVLAGTVPIRRQIRRNIIDAQLVNTGAMMSQVAPLRDPPRGTEISYQIGIRGRRATKKAPQDPWYWWLQEFGYTDRGGRHHPGKRFVSRAIADSGTQRLAFAAMARVLERKMMKDRR